MEPWFHGYVARDDLLELIKNKGDFLVRTTEPIEGKGFKYVLSVASGNPQPIRNIVLKRGQNNYVVEGIT